MWLAGSGQPRIRNAPVASVRPSGLACAPGGWAAICGLPVHDVVIELCCIEGACETGVAHQSWHSVRPGSPRGRWPSWSGRMVGSVSPYLSLALVSCMMPQSCLVQARRPLAVQSGSEHTNPPLHSTLTLPLPNPIHPANPPPRPRPRSNLLLLTRHLHPLGLLGPLHPPLQPLQHHHKHQPPTHHLHHNHHHKTPPTHPAPNPPNPNLHLPRLRSPLPHHLPLQQQLRLRRRRPRPPPLGRRNRQNHPALRRLLNSPLPRRAHQRRLFRGSKRQLARLRRAGLYRAAVGRASTQRGPGGAGPQRGTGRGDVSCCWGGGGDCWERGWQS